MAKELQPCGTIAAARRHQRDPEKWGPMCAECQQAVRDEKNGRKDAERAESAEQVRAAVAAEPVIEDVDPLAEALDNLRIVRAVLRDEGTPANTVAALTKRRDELVDRVQRLREADAPVEVSVIDELTSKRRERRAAASG